MLLADTPAIVWSLHSCDWLEVIHRHTVMMRRSNNAGVRQVTRQKHVSTDSWRAHTCYRVVNGRLRQLILDDFAAAHD